MDKKINITYMPSQNQGGVFYYRTLQPMIELKKMFPDKYEIFITDDFQKVWPKITQTDILIVHNGLYENKTQMKMWNLVTEARKIGVKTVLDIDDYWNYGEEHPLYRICMVNEYPVKAPVNFNLFDCVTTTTEFLRSQILPYNRNVIIMENAISKDDIQFVTEKNPSNRIRFGVTGGSSHVTDMLQIVSANDCVLKHLDKKTLDRIQFVLCGFNMDGIHIFIDKKGNKITRKLESHEIWWVNLEKWITDDYKIVSPEYRELLLRFDGSDEKFDSSNEPYRRIWSRSITNFEYGLIYKDIDVLMVPLTDTKFNSAKSELKFIEAGFTNTAVIASKVMPYIDFGTDNKDCLFAEDMSPKGWAQKIKEIVSDNDKRLFLTKNLHDKVLKERNIDDITKNRDALFTQLASVKKS